MQTRLQNFTFWAAILLFSICSFDAAAQAADCDPDSPKVRYRSRDFFAAPIVTSTNVPYGNDVDHVMDVYLPPATDTDTNRPLIVWAHPGGFINGTKDTDGAILFCTEMAKMGYVAISIAYRKDMVGEISGGIFNGAGAEGGALRAVYKSLQDARNAIRYMRANSGIYGIDPDLVFMAGSSAGGVMAANVAFMEDAERPWPTTGGFFRSELGCPDCGDNNANPTFSGDIQAAMANWSGTEDWVDGDGILDIIDDANDNDGDGQVDTERMLFMHGAIDQVVLPGVGKPFQNFGALAGALLPNLYGTYAMRERYASLGADAAQWEAHVLCAEDHEFELDQQDGGNGDFGPDGVPDQNFDYWFQEGTDHFYNAINPNMPETGPIETIVDNGAEATLDACDTSSKGTYAPTAYSTYRVTSPNAGSDYCWDITKGTILTGQGSTEITVRWDDTPNAAGTVDDAIGRTGTILCFEKTTNGAVEEVYKASHHLSLIVDGPSTAPIANFSTTLGAGVGQVDFTDASTNATHPTDTYEWDFGDGTTTIGTDATPSHTYNSVGTYTVTLKSMNDCGNRSDYQETVMIDGVSVSPKVYLQGPFNGADMNNDLETAALLPTNEPYTALGFAGLQNAGAALAASYVPGTGGNEAVDWVIVELRDMVTSTTVVSSRAALLQKDGDVVDTDGISAVGFINVTPGMYYVVVRHRNHLGVMTGTPVNLN